MTFFYLLHDVIFKCLPPNCRDFCRTELTLLSPPTEGSAAVGLVNLVWLDIDLNFYQSFLSALVCQISVLSLTFTPIKCSKHNTFYIKKYSRARLPVELEGLRGLTLLICSDFSHARATRAKTTIIQANRKNDIDWFFFLCPQFERMDLT